MDQRGAEPDGNYSIGPVSLYGEFTLTGNRKVRCAVSLTERDLVVQRLTSAPAGRSKVALSLKDCVGCRAYRAEDDADPAAYLAVYFYPLARRWMSPAGSRHRAEHGFRVAALQDPRANLDEAEKWARAVRERAARQQSSRSDGGPMSVLSRPSRMMLLVNPQSGKGQALTLYNNHIQRMLNEAGVTHTLVITAGRLLYGRANKSRRTHYGIFGCGAAVGTARGGGQLKEECAAVGERERQCVCYSEPLHVTMWSTPH